MIHQSKALTTTLSPTQFQLSFWLDKVSSLLLDSGRGASIKFELDKQQYVLRRYLRGGLVAKILYDQYLWKGEEQSRVYQERKVLEHAHLENLKVPEFIAYSIERNLLFYRQGIITGYIPNVGTLADVLQKRQLTSEESNNLVNSIRQMHKARINHVDLNANNILLGEDDQFYIIDFDKAQIMANQENWPKDNIQRLFRSLVKLKPSYFDEEKWSTLLQINH